jgi:hypothetical protein
VLRAITSLRRLPPERLLIFLRMMIGDYLVGTQIWLVLPTMVKAVPFVWGGPSASTLLASRLMAANTSIAIVHQIDFMDSSRIAERMHVSCRIRA